MALWEKVIPRGAAEMAREGTINLTESARVNGLITEENKKINELYLKIGKLYVESHQVSYEECFSDLIKSVADSKKTVETYQLQLQLLRGIIVCPNPDCKHEAPKGSAYCNLCGTKLPEIDLGDSYKKCSKCGAMVEKGMRFCTNCAHPMESSEDIQNRCQSCGCFVDPKMKFCPFCGKPMNQPEVPVEEPLKTGKRRCSNCNAELEDDLLYCTECGTRIE